MSALELQERLPRRRRVSYLTPVPVSYNHMFGILIEGVLFVVAIAAIAALFFFVLKTYTPLGMRIRQTENRKRIQREAESVCPIHGPHSETELVRLASGDRICPDCFREAVRDSIA